MAEANGRLVVDGDLRDGLAADKRGLCTVEIDHPPGTAQKNDPDMDHADGGAMQDGNVTGGIAPDAEIAVKRLEIDPAATSCIACA